LIVFIHSTIDKMRSFRLRSADNASPLVMNVLKRLIRPDDICNGSMSLFIERKTSLSKINVPVPDKSIVYLFQPCSLPARYSSDVRLNSQFSSGIEPRIFIMGKSFNVIITDCSLFLFCTISISIFITEPFFFLAR